MEITYTQQGDYLLPNLTLPEQDNRPIGLSPSLYQAKPPDSLYQPAHKVQAERIPCRH